MDRWTEVKNLSPPERRRLVVVLAFGDLPMVLTVVQM